MESRQVGRGSRAGEAHSYFLQIIGWKRKLPPHFTNGSQAV